MTTGVVLAATATATATATAFAAPAEASHSTLATMESAAAAGADNPNDDGTDPQTRISIGGTIARGELGSAAGDALQPSDPPPADPAPPAGPADFDGPALHNPGLQRSIDAAEGVLQH
ncbi:hypothetical protein [Pseudonocardia yunnanensis]|uniref:ATP-binding protein n=1 Tax=Pseudonocardia yunnanensis TaxID=58107 RepID=A0ABW4F4B0_9PSEU